MPAPGARRGHPGPGVGGAAGGSRLADLEQTRGELRVVRERARESCPLRVLTQVAVIVVTGADFTVRVDPDDGTTVVTVAEGSVEVYPRHPETGEATGMPVRLEAGFTSVVARGRAPSLPAPADPGTSLLSPATDGRPVPEPLGTPIPPGILRGGVDLFEDLVVFCEFCESVRFDSAGCGVCSPGAFGPVS